MKRISVIIFFPAVFILATPLLLYGYIVGKFNRKKRIEIAYSFTRFVAHSIMFISGATYSIKGLENIPEDETVLFVGNHKSMLDIPVLMKNVKFPIAFVAKDSLKKTPFLNWWMVLLDCLFLDRQNSKQALKTILYGIEKLKSGESLVIFPEGTRSTTDTLLPFKQGSLKLAEKSKVRIVPFAIKGTDSVFEKNGFNLIPNKIYLTFGKPFYIEDIPKTTYKKTGEYVQSIIQEMYDAQM
jgi:1-acyl-sn-glycerol-3-phosphate acyltransferase